MDAQRFLRKGNSLLGSPMLLTKKLKEEGKRKKSWRSSENESFKRNQISSISQMNNHCFNYNVYFLIVVMFLKGIENRHRMYRKCLNCCLENTSGRKTRHNIDKNDISTLLFYLPVIISVGWSCIVSWDCDVMISSDVGTARLNIFLFAYSYIENIVSGNWMTA